MYNEFSTVPTSALLWGHGASPSSGILRKAPSMMALTPTQWSTLTAPHSLCRKVCFPLQSSYYKSLIIPFYGIHLLRNQISVIESLLLHSLRIFTSYQYALQNIIWHLLSWKLLCDFIVINFSNSSPLFSLRERGSASVLSVMCDDVSNISRTYQFLLGVQAGEMFSFHGVTFFLWIIVQHPLQAVIG